ncbi:hypothetical protein V1477_016037 [Vespula maculifrons]|uniref:Uncharacterized protein n=1 Tax=Vespula maculifrons TaxID=7453 RepID=A0ABD2BBV6_VESMC
MEYLLMEHLNTCFECFLLYGIVEKLTCGPHDSTRLRLRREDNNNNYNYIATTLHDNTTTRRNHDTTQHNITQHTTTQRNTTQHNINLLREIIKNARITC